MTKILMNKIIFSIIRIIIFLLLIFLLIVFSFFARYRLTISKEFTIKRELVYQMIDLGQGDFFRYNLIEYPLNIRRIFTVDENGKREWFYVSKNDYNKCWENSSASLKDKKAKLLTIITKKLLFGGYSLSKIVNIEFLDKKPILSK